MNIKLLQKLLQPSQAVDIFDKNGDELLENLKLYRGEENESAGEFFEEESFVNTHKFAEEFKEELKGKACCTTCDISFDDYEAQREHFKLDWHRYNVKLKSYGRSSLSEDIFEEQVSGEMSSISGSDSESDEDLEPSFSYKREISEDYPSLKDVSIFLRHPFKKFYVSKDSRLFSIYRSILKEPDEPEFFNGRSQIKNSCFWAYLMLSAGHFAAAVFEKKNVVVHKTFHRYTVRAKRGTSQGVHDKKQGHAKSAGASIRRYNEAAMAEDISKLLQSWSVHLNKSDRIFFKCSTHHMNVLFGGKYLKKDDSRVSKISLMTNRPTLKEVKRIHQLFSTIEVHGLLSEVTKRVDEFCCTKRKDLSQNISHVNLTVENGDDLLERKKTPSPKPNHRKVKNKNYTKDEEFIKKDKEKPKKEKPKRILSELELLWNRIYKQIVKGETEKVRRFLIDENIKLEIEDTEQSTKENFSSANDLDQLKLRFGFFAESYVNFRSPDFGETLLHIAVKQNNTELINTLLMSNADPTITNLQSKVPYEIAVTKQTRNEFRRFMAKFPEKYDYKEAKIPSPLTEEAEQEKQRKIADKRKQQQKARKEKLKAKKAVEKQEKEAEKEHKAFEALSDREKRAVMAERRFASQLTTSLKCANCRAGLDAKQAFERFEYKYCSVDCVQAHKKIIGK